MSVKAFPGQIKETVYRPSDKMLKDFYNTFTFEEIANIYDVSVQTVEQWIEDITLREGGKIRYE